MLRVAKSNSELHCIAASDLDAIRDNILMGKFKLMELFEGLVELTSDKIGGYYLEYHTPKGIKKILLAGYKDKAKWKKVLGKPIECWFIDEINIADRNFFNEHKARTFSFEHPFTISTLNGDDPEHYIYQEYINESIDLFPLDTPQTTVEDMRVDKADGKYYAFWGLDDHPTMTPQKKERILNSFPEGSFYHMTKVLGIRGIQEGLIFGHIINSNHYVEWEKINLNAIREIIIGIDLGDNAKTIFTMTGFTQGYQRVIPLVRYECPYNEHELIIDDFNRWITDWYGIFAMKIKGVYPDAANSMFVKSLKRKIKYPISVKPSIKMTIVERVILLEQLIHSQRMLFAVGYGGETVAKMLKKVKSDGKGGVLDDNTPEVDDFDSLCYSITPNYKKLIKGG